MYIYEQYWIFSSMNEFPVAGLAEKDYMYGIP